MCVLIHARATLHACVRVQVMVSLAQEVQDLSMTFRKSQSQYLKRMRGREERMGGRLDTGGLDGESTVDAEGDLFDKVV